MTTAREVLQSDLKYIRLNLKEEFASLSGKNLLITGGAGFLGYYLVQSVLGWNETAEEARRVRVTVLDNYMRGMPAWLEALRGNGHLGLLKHDITASMPEGGPDYDYIIHAASIASPTYYRKHPIETMDANVNGLRFLLEYCKGRAEEDRPVEGFLFFSSSEVYGDPPPEHVPTPESYPGSVSCTGPRACYDESKRYGETLCVNFARQHGIPVKTARPFNNYGPGLKITDRRVLPDFARNVLAGQDIVMLSSGTPKRTFCYVADAIVGYYKVLVKGRSGEAYNIGVEEPEISMAELAERVVGIAGELFGYKGKVLRQVSPEKDYLVDNPNRRCPMIAKAREHLGYRPGISLEEGLKRSLIWYRDNQSAEEA